MKVKVSQILQVLQEEFSFRFFLRRLEDKSRGLDMTVETKVSQILQVMLEEFFVLSRIGKRTKEGCKCGSENGTAHSGQDWEGPAPQ